MVGVSIRPSHGVLPGSQAVTPSGAVDEGALAARGMTILGRWAACVIAAGQLPATAVHAPAHESHEPHEGWHRIQAGRRFRRLLMSPYFLEGCTREGSRVLARNRLGYRWAGDMCQS